MVSAHNSIIVRTTRTFNGRYSQNTNKSGISRDRFTAFPNEQASDVTWLLPSHGPVFRKDNALLDATITRLQSYLHMADFGTCAIDWPLMDEWDRELTEGKMPEG